MTSKKEWFRLDNSGKVYPEVYTKRESHTYRVQVELTEEVDPLVLQIASNQILKRFPMFRVKLKHGFFLTYLDYNPKELIVSEMTHKLCSTIDFHQNRGFLFKVLYRQNIIAVEMFHSLADGAGVMAFLQALVFHYLQLKGYPVKPENLIKTMDEKPRDEESEDANQLYYDKTNHAQQKQQKAYRMTGTLFHENETGLITGVVSTSKMLEYVRSKELTITEFITSLFIYSVYQAQIQYHTDVERQYPMKIAVPVNLRRFFPSNTLRNFSNVMMTQVDIDNDDLTLDEIIQTVKQQLQVETSKEVLIRKLSVFVKYGNNPFFRYLPYFIKKFLLKIGYRLLARRVSTASVTNIGVIRFPNSVEPYINGVTAILGAGRNSKDNCSIISYRDELKISFSRSIKETDIERIFFTHLTSLGMSVILISNYAEDYPLEENQKKGKKQ